MGVEYLVTVFPRDEPVGERSEFKIEIPGEHRPVSSYRYSGGDSDIGWSLDARGGTVGFRREGGWRRMGWKRQGWR